MLHAQSQKGNFSMQSCWLWPKFRLWQPWFTLHDRCIPLSDVVERTSLRISPSRPTYLHVRLVLHQSCGILLRLTLLSTYSNYIRNPRTWFHPCRHNLFKSNNQVSSCLGVTLLPLVCVTISTFGYETFLLYLWYFRHNNRNRSSIHPVTSNEHSNVFSTRCRNLTTNMNYRRRVEK